MEVSIFITCHDSFTNQTFLHSYSWCQCFAHYDIHSSVFMCTLATEILLSSSPLLWPFCVSNAWLALDPWYPRLSSPLLSKFGLQAFELPLIIVSLGSVAAAFTSWLTDNWCECRGNLNVQLSYLDPTSTQFFLGFNCINLVPLVSPSHQDGGVFMIKIWIFPLHSEKQRFPATCLLCKSSKT